MQSSPFNIIELKGRRNMINAYAINSLSGHTHYTKKCTCGHEEYIEKTNGVLQTIPFSLQEYCPNCGTPLMTTQSNTLSFAPTQQTAFIGKVNTKKRPCYLEFELYDINFYTSIDFQKKAIKIDKRKIKNKMVKIVFDASQKPEDFIKYYKEGFEEINKDEFINALDRDAQYMLTEKKDIERYFSLIQSYIYPQMSIHQIQRLIDILEKNKDFFIKHEQIIKAGIDPYPIRIEIDSTKTTPAEMLGVRPFTFKYLRSLKDGIDLATLRAIKRMEEKIGDQAVYYLQTFGQDPECLQTRFMDSILDLVCEADLSVSKLFKYVYKEVPTKQFIIEPVEIITLLRDCFEMSKNLGLVFNKNSKTLQRYHDELAEEHKTVADKMLAKSFTRSMKKKEYLAYSEEESKYCIVVPTESQELVKEGQELRHCVGSYIKRVASGTSFIVFLRHKDEPEKSFTTIEINEYDKIVQIRKKHNASLEEKDAREFVKNWAEANALDTSWVL